MPSVTAAEVRCPACERGFLAGVERSDEVHCVECSSSYPVQDAVIDLLPNESMQRSLAQRSMEAEPIVRIYESRFWRRGPHVAFFLGIPFEEEMRLILRAAQLTGAEKILDLACGPGIYTRSLARQISAGSVVGLDLSLPMLRYASRRVREEGLENVLLIHGNALNLPFPPDHFDVVNCCGALHLFPDVPRALREIHRVLRPSGRFTVATFRRSDGRVARLRAATRRRLTGLDAFSSRDLESLLQAAGLSDVQCHHARAAWLIMSARKPEEANLSA